MRDWDWLIAVIFGLGLTVAIATPIMKEVGAGDLLSFAGVSLGVGGAVLAGMAINRDALRLDRQRRLRRLRENLDKLETIQLNSFYLTSNSQVDSLAAFRGMCLGIFNAIEIVEYAWQRVDIENPDIVAAMNVLTRRWCDHKRFLEERSDPVFTCEPEVAQQGVETLIDWIRVERFWIDRARKAIDSEL